MRNMRGLLTILSEKIEHQFEGQNNSQNFKSFTKLSLDGQTKLGVGHLLTKTFCFKKYLSVIKIL